MYNKYTIRLAMIKKEILINDQNFMKGVNENFKHLIVQIPVHTYREAKHKWLRYINGNYN